MRQSISRGDVMYTCNQYGIQYPGAVWGKCATNMTINILVRCEVHVQPTWQSISRGGVRYTCNQYGNQYPGAMWGTRATNMVINIQGRCEVNVQPIWQSISRGGVRYMQPIWQSISRGGVRYMCNQYGNQYPGAVWGICATHMATNIQGWWEVWIVWTTGKMPMLIRYKITPYLTLNIGLWV